MRLVTCHKGRIALRLGARGLAHHSSNPDRGSNAILPLARAALALGELHRELGAQSDPRLGSGTLTVTMISGGHAPNIVPDRAVLIADRRTLPGETVESVRGELTRALERAELSELVTIEYAQNEKNALGTRDDHPAVQVCQRALTSRGLPSAAGSAAFATDAGPIAAHGIASVVLGPGDIAQAHTADEFVSLDEVEAMQAVFEHLLAGEGAG
jgi:acetylornithine deacetylase/succinyl-diaminopimelate desuccinylase-like protein